MFSLTLSTRVSSADARSKFHFSPQNFEIQIFMAIFGISLKNELKWVQTGLCMVQLFLRKNLGF